MAKLGKTFIAEGHDTLNDYEPIPAGDYTAKIVESEKRDTKARDGWMIVFKWEVLGGEYNGRFIYDNCNLGNKSEKAVAVANKQLATICQSIGRAAIEDTEELHGKPMTISVGIQDSPGYGKQNRVKSYKPYAGGQAPELPKEETPKEEKKKAPWDD